MTERKPPGVDFESFVDKQIREAAERGAFDDLPGAGKPLPDDTAPYDELWWVKDKMRRENASFLPPVLALRKEAQDARRAALEARSEREARKIVEDVDARIREALRTPPPGPPLNLAPLGADAIAAQWRERHHRG